MNYCSYCSCLWDSHVWPCYSGIEEYLQSDSISESERYFPTGPPARWSKLRLGRIFVADYITNGRMFQESHWRDGDVRCRSDELCDLMTWIDELCDLIRYTCKLLTKWSFHSMSCTSWSAVLFVLFTSSGCCIFWGGFSLVVISLLLNNPMAP